VRYFADTLGNPETSAITEVERYCVWPGQACAYMLGKLTFLAQRARAQKMFGEKYDVRKFHDAMLLPGGVRWSCSSVSMSEPTSQHRGTCISALGRGSQLLNELLRDQNCLLVGWEKHL